MRVTRAVLITVLAGVFVPTTHAQVQPYSILNIELEKATLYVIGYCGPSDRGKNPNKLPAPSNGLGNGYADIVSVNGQPVKGTAFENIVAGGTNPNLTPGSAIGDVSGFPAPWDLAFLNLDDSMIGTIHVDGLGGPPRPPGAPKEITNSAWIVTGGSGAFFGVRGYYQPVQDRVSGERRTTDCEDPAYRRINADPGGNKRHPILYLVPLEAPQILTTPNGPAVVHASDNTLVTPTKPAKAGEILSLFASGLGPTKPGVDPGQPFPADALQLVNSPVQVLVNGNAGDVLYAGGFPGAVDGYQVNFRVPDNTSPGPAALQVTSAWIGGPLAYIPVR